MLRRRLFSFFSVLTLCSVLFGQGCTRGPDAATASASKRVEINMWGVIDDVDVYNDILKEYHALHPNVTINFRRLRLEEYEDELLNALAEDKGPDVFMVHNSWVSKYESKIAPMPLTTKVAVQRVVGTVKKETVYVLENQPTISVRKYKDAYPEAVAADTIRTVNVSTIVDERKLEQRVMAMPLSVDTLGLYVNKDLLNAAGIATVPRTWDAFQTTVPRLVKQDSQGELIQSAASFGTGYNVEREPDIVAALMMQNGTEMVAEDGSPTFALLPPALSSQREEPPAFQALSFYTDFANPAKSVYSWNDKQPNSLDSFIQGRSAYFLGYSYHLPVIRSRAPKLNLGISSLPQIDGNPIVNYANYWNWTVSKKTKSTEIAWNLINFMIQPDQAKKYLDAAGRPAADKSLLEAQLEDEEVGVFASQVLTAKSWYRGQDPQAMEDAFQAMVDNVLKGVEEIPTAVRNAQSKVSQTVRFNF
ncbi:MAG: extracellular solute-binding protein [Patescibacteria group bacterium]|jgi:ABC-type glycerol-3-phosphate transport system substrate-binding protein